MAKLSISEAKDRIRGLPKKVAEEAVWYMKYDLDRHFSGPGHEQSTGGLSKSVRSRRNGLWTYSVGPTKKVGGTETPWGTRYKKYNLGSIVRQGRPALKPRPENPYQKLVWKVNGKTYMAQSVGRADGYDFIETTKEHLMKIKWKL